MATSTPKVGILFDRLTMGIRSLAQLGDQANLPKSQHPSTIQEACETAWAQDDAHITTYFPVGPKIAAGAGWPRINKIGSTVLQEMRANECDLVAQVLIFDFDNPNHAEWKDEEQVNRWIEEFVRVMQADPEIAGKCACLYTTRSGARMIFILDRPVRVEDAESHHRWMVSRLRSASDVLSEEDKRDPRTGREMGGVDPSCSDWTRLFRLPKVCRDGKHSWHSPTFKMIGDWNARLPVESLGRKEAANAAEGASVAAIVGKGRIRPEREEALGRRLRMHPVTGRMSQTDFFTFAKQVLTGKDCWRPAFDEIPIAQEGDRDNTIWRMVAQACGTIVPRKDCDPEDIYALFLPSVENMEQGDPPIGGWEHSLWDKVCRLWATEVAKKQAIEAKRAADQRTDADKMLVLLQGMQEWCKAHELQDLTTPEGVAAASDYARRRAILICKREYYILQETGVYLPYPKMDNEIIPHLRSRGLEWIIPTKSLDHKTGEYKDRGIPSITNSQGVDVEEIELRSLGKLQAIFENHGSLSRKSKIIISPYARNPDLKPEFSEDVDAWLQVLFGVHYEMMCKYLGFALAIEDGPVAALSIKAPPGVGKKLLFRGLVECLCDPVAADAMDMIGNYQYGFLKSPFIIVDEGWPSDKFAQQNISDVFRKIVTGAQIKASTKFSHPIEVSVAPRILMSANNDSTLDVFNSFRATTVQDQNAIADRLIHIEVGDAARHWLRARGGIQFTGAEGRRWIKSDGKEPSDYIVAKHLMHLYATRGKAPGKRMLVDGCTDILSLERVRMSTMAAQTIAEAIVAALELRSLSSDVPPGMQWNSAEGKLYVSIKSVEKACETFSGSKVGRVDVRLRIKEIMEHLPSVCESSDPTYFPEGDGGAYFEVSLGTLMRHAKRIGQSCKKIANLVVAQEAARQAIIAGKSVGVA